METPLPCSKEKAPKLENCNPNSPFGSPIPSPSRLWRPAAQRNLRNQWSKLLSSKDRWISVAAEGRSHATDLVNAYLSQRYVPMMELGVLKDMPGIRKKACEKLVKKQELCCNKLLSSYKSMVLAVSHLVKASRSMRCYVKGPVFSPLIQFCEHTEDVNDTGDGGGLPVFSFFSVSNFENLAQELIGMLMLEQNLKRLLVVELLSITYSDARGGQTNILSWSNELYPGEFDDLRISNMLSEESHQPPLPRIKDLHSGSPFTGNFKHPPSPEVLQVYLTTWLADVNIDMNRINEIFAMVEEEMQVKLS